jgi:hypothetical protein
VETNNYPCSFVFSGERGWGEYLDQGFLAVASRGGSMKLFNLSQLFLWTFMYFPELELIVPLNL